MAPQPANVQFFPIEFPQNASRLSKKEIHTDWELSISMLDYPGAYHQHLSIVKQQDSHGFRHSDTYDSHYLATNFNTNIKSCFLCLADSSWITHSKLKKAKDFPWTTWMNSRFRLFKPSTFGLRSSPPVALRQNGAPFRSRARFQAIGSTCRGVYGGSVPLRLVDSVDLQTKWRIHGRRTMEVPKFRFFFGLKRKQSQKVLVSVTLKEKHLMLVFFGVAC